MFRFDILGLKQTTKVMTRSCETPWNISLELGLRQFHILLIISLLFCVLMQFDFVSTCLVFVIKT